MPIGDRTIERGLESGIRGSIRFAGDFLVEFLGGLLPGIIFTVGLFSVFVPCLCLFLTSLNRTSKDYSISETIHLIFNPLEIESNIWWVGFFGFWLIFSYVFGHLFYRRDPKTPNAMSYKRITRKKPDIAELRKHFSGRRNEFTADGETKGISILWNDNI